MHHEQNHAQLALSWEPRRQHVPFPTQARLRTCHDAAQLNSTAMRITQVSAVRVVLSLVFFSEFSLKILQVVKYRPWSPSLISC